MEIVLLIVVIVAVLLVLYIIGVYNGLIKVRNRSREAWADIDVQLKRRYNLIPNLVESVKGYAKHEQETFQAVTEARADAMKAQSPAEHGKQEARLGSLLGNLLAVAENYPELKASENFQMLQQELSDTENKIQAARRFYNGQILKLNNKLQVFPTNIIGGWLRFKAGEFFELEDKAQRENVQVKF